MSTLPSQRWQIAPAQPEHLAPLIQATGLPPLLAQVLLNRELNEPRMAQLHLYPEQAELPDPLVAFTPLGLAVEILAEAIASAEPIVICGDYDADGMTSTGLLMRALRSFGATVNYAIPSRMKEGYGINTRIVEQAAEAGVGVIITVDNGIAALEPIQFAVELGLSVIVTDHHDIPEELPPADAILNPKLLPEDSPYRGLAGVGVAYLLAVALGDRLGADPVLISPLLELCTLGTIADLAPLTGVNRRWVKQGLRALPKSKLAGVQALMTAAGVLDAKKPMRPDEIGFRLGPRINAVGRIGDPVHVIELLTTDDPAVAQEQADHCEETNRRRKKLCEAIEAEALAVIETEQLDAQAERVLVVFKPDWHHGVIGIVASRLVERYGVPVFICTNEGAGEIRGSARGIPEFHVYEALKFCDDLLPKYGGHRAAGGFSCPAQNLAAFRDRLREFAHQCLEPQHLKPLVTIDVQATFAELTAELYEQIEDLQPWGMGNPTPVFWSANVEIISQKTVKGNHLKLQLAQDCEGQCHKLKAIAWRWGDYAPLSSPIDVAYKLTENQWRGKTTIELEVVGVRASAEVATVDTVPETGGDDPDMQPTGLEGQPMAMTSAKVISLPVQSLPPEPIPADATVPEPASASDANAAEDIPPEVALTPVNPEPAALDALLANEPQPKKAILATGFTVDNADFTAENSVLAQDVSREETAIAAAHRSPSASPDGALPAVPQLSQTPSESAMIAAAVSPIMPPAPQPKNTVEFSYRDRLYTCGLAQSQTELRIRNAQGKVLAVQKGQRTGLLGERRETAVPVDVTQPHYYSLIKTALAALEQSK
ncbi:MAG: single-stranded-DNA-specific exonuclease RecJ [Cyanobacteria bacterium P01_G01_bin.54]